MRGIAVRSFGFEFKFFHSPSGELSGEREISELRSPLSPVLCSLVLPCSLPFAILRSSQKVALPASATGSGRACFPQRPPIPFGQRSNPNKSEIGRPIHSYTFPTCVRVAVVHSSLKLWPRFLRQHGDIFCKAVPRGKFANV